MENLTGKWVLLKDDKIIDSDNDPTVLYKKVQELKDDKIIISKIPSSSSCFY